jgi:transcriptional regulator with XRE-family HTH domain
MNSAAEIRQVGLKIRRLREARGLSQETAARLAGIDRSYYGRIERGKINVSSLYLLRIAEMLDTTVGRFFPEKR